MQRLLRKGAGLSLRFVKSQGFYRAIGRRIFRGGINITTVSPSHLEYVHTKLNPGVLFRPSFSDPLVTRLVTVRHGQVIGFVELVRHPPEHAPYVGHWLFSLYVLDPWYRGIGIGEDLVRCVIGIASHEGAGELWLLVGETNYPAINLYIKLGFERITIEDLEDQLEKEALNTGYRRVTMVKRLYESRL